MNPPKTATEKAWGEFLAISHLHHVSRAREDEEMRQEFYLKFKAAIVDGNQESFAQNFAWHSFRKKQVDISRHHENLSQARSLFDSIVTNSDIQATAHISANSFAREAAQKDAFTSTDPTSSVSGVYERRLSFDSTVSASGIPKAAEMSLHPLVPSLPTQSLDHFVPVDPVILDDDKAKTSGKRQAAPKTAIEKGGEEKGNNIRSSVTPTSPLKPLRASTTLANNVPPGARVSECPKGSERYFIFVCPVNSCHRYMDTSASMYAHLNQGNYDHLTFLNGEKTFAQALSVGGIEVIGASVEWVDEHNKAAKALNAARFP